MTSREVYASPSQDSKQTCWGQIPSPILNALKIMLYDLLIEETIQHDAKRTFAERPTYFSSTLQQKFQHSQTILSPCLTRSMRLVEPEILLPRLPALGFEESYEILVEMCGCGVHPPPQIVKTIQPQLNKTTSPLVCCWVDSNNHRGTFAAFQRHFFNQSATQLPSTNTTLPIPLEMHLLRCSSQWLLRLLISGPQLRLHLLKALLDVKALKTHDLDLRFPAYLNRLIQTGPSYSAKVLGIVRDIAKDPAKPQTIRQTVLTLLPALFTPIQTTILPQLAEKWDKFLQKYKKNQLTLLSNLLKLFFNKS
jgi:hypothetical protein